MTVASASSGQACCSSLFAVAADALRTERWLVVGAALMWAFFRVASVPLMDARSLSRRSDYVQVMASTSALLLMPPGFRIGALRAVDAPLAGGTAAGLGKKRVEWVLTAGARRQGGRARRPGLK